MRSSLFGRRLVVKWDFPFNFRQIEEILTLLLIHDKSEIFYNKISIKKGYSRKLIKLCYVTGKTKPPQEIEKTSLTKN